MGMINIDAMDDLQEFIGSGNAARGFHDEGDRLRGEALDGIKHADSNLRNYQISKIALIGTEDTEAIEELRNGRGGSERYYSGGSFVIANDGTPTFDEHEGMDHAGMPRKPEGVPSELADVVIRAFDFADEEGFSLGTAIEEKLAYNATRGRMHGGKKI